MTPAVRLRRFAFVGALGSVLQLGLVRQFSRWLPGHALLPSLAALELTLVHNFCWHRRYTWRDRTEALPRRAWAASFARFWLGNGAVSLLSSLALLPLLVRLARWPLLLANAAVIPSGAGLNFLLASSWTFAATGSARRPCRYTSPVRSTAASNPARSPASARCNPPSG